MADAPILRLDLEFIQSNITDIENVIKINFIKRPGAGGKIELFSLEKYVIDSSETSILDSYTQYMLYIGDNIYMSSDIYMGGLEVANYSKSNSELSKAEWNLSDLTYVLDYTLNNDDIVVYILKYKYRGVIYYTPMVISYRPIKSKPIYKEYVRPCITSKNLRYRGTPESYKINELNQEIFCDLRNLTAYHNEINSILETTNTDIDDSLNNVYNIQDSVAYYNKYF